MNQTAKKNIDWTSVPLGIVADSVIAARLNVTRNTVRYQRERRGLDKPPTPPKAGLARKVYFLLSDCKAHTVDELCDETGCAVARMRSLLVDLLSRGIVRKWPAVRRKPLQYSLIGVHQIDKHSTAFHGATMRATQIEQRIDFDVRDPVVEPSTCQLIEYDTEDRSDAFFCCRKQQQVTLAHCVELFTEVHAYLKRTAICMGCQQGAINRLRHCYEVEPSQSLVSDLLDTVLNERKRSAAESRLMLAMERGKK